jgi:hypothetical protein
MWAFFGPPSIGILVTLVFIVNFGGAYNCVAYTVIRYRLKQQRSSHGTKVVLGHGDRQVPDVKLSTITT